jgi:UDP-N-acetylglucosamine 2-epimerase
MHAFRVVGARPQFMQVPAFTSALRSRGGRQTLVHTGQHYDDNMSKIFFEELGLPRPDLNLHVGSGSHAEQTGAMLVALEKAMLEVKPDVVVIDGDTNSTLAAALAARKLDLPLVHIEAGVRCGIRQQPEEINRVATDHLADLLCAPTPSGLANLAAEGLADRTVLTGDVMLDCYLTYKGQADEGALQRLGLKPGKYIVSTLHRAETTGSYELLSSCLDAIESLGIPAVFPAHPRLSAHIERYQTERELEHLMIIEPVGYLTMLALVRGCDFVVTDSGGVTREAPFSGKPVVLVGENTAWQDLVLEGFVIPWVPGAGSITDATKRMHRPDINEVRAMFGAGRAAERIVAAMYARF